MAWAAVYNALWAVAWLGFMRREWSGAASASGHPMPFRGGFWALWVPITLLFGIAVTGYLTGKPGATRARRAAAAASLVIWVPSTVGMAVGVGFSVRIIVLDSAVNLLALLVASAVVARGVASRRRERR